MRKAQKNQAEEIMRLLAHVHEGIKKAIETGRRDEAMGLLAQCQESAINLGEMIEETEGEGTEAVSSLEEYCENVYQIYSMLEQGQSISGQKAWKSLRRALVQAENHIKNDIKVRVEAVFLPYKASMWDSLESVWRAADEDPDCDAYVIPIPYYDKNPDGSFREEHYEGESYPEDVPVIWYEDYDFAGRRPDMIFIHNPYDNCNYVTSVHPFFYSQNLKQFTDKLVYIPYFILGEIEPDDKVATEGMVNYCNVPAVYYADKVIVQSEKMRQVYINVLSEITKNTAGSEKYWGEKILGLGSPKVDKVLSTRKENVEVPEEWLKIIEKPDGSWKKIIFYNTGLTGLLQHAEKMLVKMQDVFRVFKENRGEVALLWRPHPLIKATIESMRPHLWEEYEKIVEEYKKAGWGIYDDTAEMDRAIALCDAYYGDHSSLVRLCQEAGKPVMIQDVECINNKGKWQYLPFDGGYYFNRKIWSLNREENALYAIDVETAEIDYIDSLEVEGDNKRAYCKIIKNNKYFYLFPGTSKNIIKYDIEERKKQYIGLSNNLEMPWNAYSTTLLYKESIYVFPSHSKSILKLDTIAHQISYIVLPGFEVSKEIFNKYGYFVNRFIRINDKIILPCAFINKLLIFNLKDETYIWKSFQQIHTGFKDIIRMKEDIFLLDREMNIFRLNINLDGDLEKIYHLNEDYYYMVGAKKKIFLIPTGENKICKVNLNEFKIEYCNYPKEHSFYKEMTSRGAVTYADIVENDEKVYLIPRFSNMLVSVDKNKNEIDFVKWHLKKSATMNMVMQTKKKLKENRIVYENVSLLNYYIHYIQCCQYMNIIDRNTQLYIGPEIYIDIK